jgi:hypothetical protein
VLLLRSRMPQIVRFNNCKICIYPDDHLPPHFHVRGKGWEVQVSLDTFTVIVGKGCKADIDEAIQWAKGKQEQLYVMWRKLNERD